MPNFDLATEVAGTGEYVQLEFTVEETPLSSDSGYVNEINAALNTNDAFIIARPANLVVHGASTLGVGYGAVEAVIRTTALANNKRYADLLANVQNFGGVLFPNIKLVDWNYVDNANDTQLNNGTAPPLMATGATPSPIQKALGSDPISNAVKPITDLGKGAVDAAKSVANITEIALVAVIFIAIAWGITEYRKS